MKNNILKIVLALFVTITYTSCEQDPIVFDADNGQTGLSFASASQTVDFCVGSSTVTVESTTRSGSDRTYTISVNAAGTTAMANEYSVASSVTIPAGEFVGTTTFTPDFAAIPEGEARVVALDLIASDGAVINTRGTTAINFSSACTLNEVNFNFIFDNYPEETAWQLYDADTGAFIDGDTGFGNYAGQDNLSVTLCIPSGNYDFVVFDQFGDGICCAYGNGAIDGTLVSCDGNSSLFDTIDVFGGQITRSFSVGN